jgi:RNA polymerase sigma factor (sigma-70 family)
VRQELRDRIQSALTQLAPGDREVLWFRHFDQFPFRDVATVLEISENTAIQRYVRALRRLKDLLPDLYKPEGGTS